MSELSSRPAGSIYDLGYRNYDGQRLGRPYAITSLFLYSLRAIFGLGRSTMSKVFPIGLAIIALIPAGIQLGVAAISPVDFDVVSPENYFGFVQLVVALFCAVAAPEIIGRDQRYKILTLYFSRALSRTDYVIAKLAALTAAIFAILTVPQLLLLLGNAVAASDIVDYLQDNIDLLAPILATSLVAGIMMAGVSLAIGSQTSRRAFATGAILAYFVLFTAIGTVLLETATGDVQRFAGLISPFTVLDGAVYWLFSAEPSLDSDLEKADLAGGFYLLAALAYSAVSIGLLLRRFLRLSV